MSYCGAFNINKPAGITSREVVDRVLKLVRPAKVGHAGTLDPLATGVLVVCVGHATRLINLVQEGVKRYRGRFRLGIRSNTDDITGQLIEDGNWSQVTRQQLEDLLFHQTGQIQQVPPQFSAVHVAGQRAYELARRGETLELDARPVEIHRIQLIDFQPPEFELVIECGSGTYVRSIGRDLGDQLGCGAVMTQLRRISVGSFHVDHATPVDQLNKENLNQLICPATNIVSHLPQRSLTTEEAIAVRRGQSLKPAAQLTQITAGEEQRTALTDESGELIGIGMTDPATGRLQPKIIFPV